MKVEIAVLVLKLFCAFVVCILGCSFYVESASENYNRTSGKCGDTVDWFYDTTTCMLTISGSGTMVDFSKSEDVPWNSYRESIKSIVIESGVTSIGQYAFTLCENLTNVALPSTLETIERYAFYYCSRLTHIVIPENVETIKGNVFVDCYELVDIKVDENNPFFKEVDGVLFSKDCSSLIAYPNGKLDDCYTISEDVNSINDCAFEGSKHLKSVNIPDSVASIGAFAFGSCYALTNITIPASVTSIGVCPFVVCKDLASINVDEKNPAYKSLDGVLLNKEGTSLIQYPVGKKDDSYTIPDGVATISESAFQHSVLTTMIIPASVTSIRSQAFGYSKNLQNVTYLGAPDFVANDIFHECEQLSVVFVPLEYESEDCGNVVVCKKEYFDGTQTVENRCFEVVNINGSNCLKMRSSVSEWEMKTNGCVEYTCNKDTGVVAVSKCKAANNICVNNECTKDEGKPDKAWSVNITINQKDKDDLVELNTTGIVEVICELTGLNSDDVIVEIEMDDNGNIMNVIVYLDDEQSVGILEDYSNNCATTQFPSQVNPGTDL